MTRRTALKALLVFPIGISLTRFTEATAQAVMELWQGTRLIAVRPVPVTTTYETYSYDLTAEEVAAVTRWDQLRVRLAANVPVAWESVELAAPPPQGGA